MSAMVDFSGRLKQAMDWNGLKADGLVERVEMTRRSAEPTVSRSAVYDYRDGTKRPGIDRAAVLARALGVRLEWLVQGKPPMRGDALVFTSRPIQEIDGLAADSGRPPGPESERIRAEFAVGYWKGREGKGLGSAPFRLLADVVQIAFGNLLARVMHVLKLAGHGAGVADARWRGEVARLLYLRIGPPAGFNKKPESTDAWLLAIANEMRFWRPSEMSRGREPAPPSDFEVPAPPG